MFPGSSIAYRKPVKMLTTINSVIDFVSEYIDTKFYIAGGSISALYNDNLSYDDIDVYFYNKQDLKYAVNTLKEEAAKYLAQTISFADVRNVELDYTTENAYSFTIDNQKVQLIKYTGTIQETFDSFDLNKSKICSTEDYIIEKDETFNEDLFVDLTKLKSGTLSRITKYQEKGYTLKDKEIERIYNHVIENKDLVLKGYYTKHDIRLTDAFSKFVKYSSLEDIVEKYIVSSNLEWTFEKELVKSFKVKPKLEQNLESIIAVSFKNDTYKKELKLKMQKILEKNHPEELI